MLDSLFYPCVSSDSPGINAPARCFLTIEEAAGLAGITQQRLRQLARTGQLPYRGSAKDPLFAVETLRSLRHHDLGPLPDWLSQNGTRSQPRRPGRPSSRRVCAKYGGSRERFGSAGHPTACVQDWRWREAPESTVDRKPWRLTTSDDSQPALPLCRDGVWRQAE